MAFSSPQGLRQRKFLDDESGNSADAYGQPEKMRQAREEVVWGKTPGGEGECQGKVLDLHLTKIHSSLSGTNHTRRPNRTFPSTLP